MLLLLGLLLAAVPASVRVTDSTGAVAVSVTAPGVTGTQALAVQGVSGGVPLNISGVISVAGTADIPGNTATFNANNVCTSVLAAGEQSVGFHLSAGTLDATLTAYYTQAIGAVNCATAGTCTQTTFTSGATIVVTNPNGVKDVGINVVGGIRQVEVCTTTFNSGTTTGLVTATFVQAAISGGGAATTATQGPAAAANAPWSMELSDGASFYVAAKTGQLPTALDGSGFLKVHEQGTATITGTVTLGAGAAVIGHVIADSGSTTAVTGNVTVVQATGTNLHVVVDTAPTTTVIGTITANAGSGTFTNQQSNVQIDYDTGGGTQNTTVFGIALPASGGAVAGGTATNPIRTDPTGTTTQPVVITAGAAVIGHVITDTGSTTAVTGTVTVAGTVAATQSGTWTVQPGNTANTTPWLMSIAAGGNTATVTAGNALKVDGSAVTQPVSGTVSATQSGAWNITNISGTVSLPTGAATDASVTGLEVSQGSTTSGQKGVLSLCAVTTAAPTYTTAQSAPCSVDTAGNLRITGTISASNPSVSTTGAAVPASATYLGGNKAGNLVGVTLDGSGNLNVNVAAGGGSGGTSSSFGAAFPATGTAAGFKVVSSAPTLSNGNMEAPTLDTAGNLRTSITTALPAGANVIGALTANQSVNLNQVGGSAVTLGQKTMAASIPVVLASDWTEPDITAGATVISAVCTDANINACGANSTVSVQLAGENSTSASWVNSTFTSTLQADCQIGGSTWQLANAFQTGSNCTGNPAGIAYGASSVTAAASILCPQGATAARIRANAAVTNTTSVTLKATTGAGVCSADPRADRGLITEGGVITLTTTTETTLVAAGGAGVSLDLSFIHCENTSATLVRADVRDATAGTVRDSYVLAASGGSGGAVFQIPWKQTTANNNWTVQLSGAVTDVRCRAQAVQKR